MKSILDRIFSAAALLCLVIAFQNCTSGFTAATKASENASQTTPSLILPDNQPVTSAKCSQSLLNLADRTIKISSLQDPTQCLSYNAESVGSDANTSACATSSRNEYELRLDPKTCRFTAQLKSKAVYSTRETTFEPSPYCLKNEPATGRILLASCNPDATSDTTSEWSVEEGEAALTIRSSDGRCLTIGSSTKPAFETCQSTTAQKLKMIESVVSKPETIELGKPIGTDFWDSAGISIKPENFSSISGFDYLSYPTEFPKPILELKRANPALEFSFMPLADGLYILHAHYSSNHESSFDVIQDGIRLGRMNLRSSGAWRKPTEGGGGFLIRFKKGVLSKIRIENDGATNPMKISSLRLSPPISADLPLFGHATEIAADRVSLLTPLQINDAYRLPLNMSDPAKPYWPCPWSYCFVEFKIKVLQASRYEIKLNYSTPDAGPHGQALYIDDQHLSTIAIANSDDGIARWELELKAGEHLLKLAHPLSDLDTFAHAGAIKMIYFTPLR